jgi:ribosomal protein S18 acetylase RimI-like enzyme
MLEKINKLITAADKMYPLTKDYLDSDSLHVTYESNGEVVGFIWAGLMCNGTIAYVDNFVVHPEYQNSDIGQRLATDLFSLAKRRGVKEVIATIKHDEHLAPCVAVCEKHGLLPVKTNYSYLHSFMSDMRGLDG